MTEAAKAPYTIFGKTKLIPLVTYTNGVKDDEPKWHWKDTLWVEREEDYYALLNKEFSAGTVRVVERHVWLRVKD